MRMYDIVKKKRDAGTLTKEEIEYVAEQIKDVLGGYCVD